MESSSVHVKRNYRPGDEIVRLNDELYGLAKEARETGDTDRALEVYRTIIKMMDTAVKYIGPRTRSKGKSILQHPAAKLLKPEHRQRIEQAISDTQQQPSGMLLDEDLWESDGTPKFGRA